MRQREPWYGPDGGRRETHLHQTDEVANEVRRCGKDGIADSRQLVVAYRNWQDDETDDVRAEEKVVCTFWKEGTEKKIRKSRQINAKIPHMTPGSLISFYSVPVYTNFHMWDRAWTCAVPQTVYPTKR